MDTHVKSSKCQCYHCQRKLMYITGDVRDISFVAKPKGCIGMAFVFDNQEDANAHAKKNAREEVIFVEVAEEYDANK